VRLEASTKPHVHQKFEIFWTNIASTLACPNFKNGPKTRLRPLGVNPHGLQFEDIYFLKSKSSVLGEVSDQGITFWTY
jgi:hypothetical protein